MARLRKVERERRIGKERSRRGGEDISSPGAYSSIFPSSRSPSHRRTPSGAVVPLGSGPYERVTHAFLFHTRSVGLRVRTCVPHRGPFKCTCENPCLECACPFENSRPLISSSIFHPFPRSNTPPSLVHPFFNVIENYSERIGRIQARECEGRTTWCSNVNTLYRSWNSKFVEDIER